MSDPSLEAGLKKPLEKELVFGSFSAMDGWSGCRFFLAQQHVCMSEPTQFIFSRYNRIHSQVPEMAAEVGCGGDEEGEF